jgi:sortase A
MTTVAPSGEITYVPLPPAPSADGPALPDGEQRAPLTPRRLIVAVVVWLVAALACIALVLYLLEPMFQSRHQADLLTQYQLTVLHASHELDSLAGETLPTHPPAWGSAVGVLEIGRLHLRQVVVEGASSGDTSGGPGHVPGTAGLGQPSNSVVVGRRSLFGGPFGSIDQLRSGDRMLVTTTEGQSVYQVTSVRTSVPSSRLPALYRISAHAQLTLVTSGSSTPWSTDPATVVVTKLVGRPFQPTPQHARSSAQTGTTGESSAWLQLLAAAGVFIGAVVLAGYLYRRSTLRVAYLLTTPALIVSMVLLAEATSRLLPAWA